MNRHCKRGMTLVEIMIAVGIMAFILLAISRVMLSLQANAFNSRLQIRASRLADMIQTRYSNMFFGYVISVDSRQPNFGLPAGATYPVFTTQTVVGATLNDAWNNATIDPALLPQTGIYPEQATLKEIQKRIHQAGFTHFAVTVTPLRRDLSGVTGDIKSLVPFLDLAAPVGVDDVDPSLQILDRNGDGDTVDFFWWPNMAYYTSEKPNTHIAQLEIRLFKQNETVVSKRGQVLTLEGLGKFNNASTLSDEAAYGILMLNMPSTMTVTLFDLNDGNIIQRLLQIGTQGFAGEPGFSIVYPSTIVAVRADRPFGTPVRFSGWTEPGSTIQVRKNPDPAEVPLDSFVADIAGNFDFPAPNLNATLVPGWNRFALRSTKGMEISPFLIRNIIWDTRPPKYENPHPPDNTMNIRTLTPFIQVDMIDVNDSTDVVSGVCPESIRFLRRTAAWVEVASEYDPVRNGRVLWVDPATSLPPTLVNGTTYDWKVIGGDRAHYKRRFPPLLGEYKFKVNILPDASPPIAVVSHVTAGANVTFTVALDDDKSGVDLKTFEMDFGPNPGVTATVFNSAIPQRGRWFEKDPASYTGAIFNYTLPTPVGAGNYKATVRVKNHQGLLCIQDYFFAVP